MPTASGVNTSSIFHKLEVWRYFISLFLWSFLHSIQDHSKASTPKALPNFKAQSKPTASHLLCCEVVYRAYSYFLCCHLLCTSRIWPSMFIYRFSISHQIPTNRKQKSIRTATDRQQACDNNCISYYSRATRTLQSCHAIVHWVFSVERSTSTFEAFDANWNEISVSLSFQKFLRKKIA